MLRSKSNAAARPMVPYLRTPTSEEEVAYWTTAPTDTRKPGGREISKNAGSQSAPVSGSRAIPAMGGTAELSGGIQNSPSGGTRPPGTTVGQGGLPNGTQPSDTANQGGVIDENWSQNMGARLNNAMGQMTPISGQENDRAAQANPPKSAFEPSNHFIGTMRGLLARNLGQYVVATFLVGPQNIMTWEGFLHSVGEDYLVLYQPSRRRYASAELNGLKFIEFYEPNNVIPGYGETYR